MKRKKLLKIINSVGAVFIRHGKSHDLYENPRTKDLIPIPRHSDVSEYTALFIIKELSKKKKGE